MGLAFLHIELGFEMSFQLMFSEILLKFRREYFLELFLNVQSGVLASLDECHSVYVLQ